MQEDYKNGQMNHQLNGVLQSWAKLVDLDISGYSWHFLSLTDEFSNEQK